MNKLTRTVSFIMTVAMLAALFAGCVTEPPAQTEPPTEAPTTAEIPQPIGTHYTLVEKTIDGLDITARFLLNLLTLSDGQVTWTEITSSGAETVEGTYEVKGDVLSV